MYQIVKTSHELGLILGIWMQFSWVQNSSVQFILKIKAVLKCLKNLGISSYAHKVQISYIIL